MNNVIVIGKNYAITLGVIRALGEANYHTKLIGLSKYTGIIAGKSKYITDTVTLLSNQTGTPDFEELFCAMETMRGKEDRILVIPLHDATCMVLDQHASQLELHYDIPKTLNNHKNLSYYMDKSIQKELAQRCGLLTAQGKKYNINIDEETHNIYKEVVFPCFFKALFSAEMIGAKNLLTKCSNENDLETAIEKAHEGKCDNVLIEEFLPIDKELTAYGVAANGEVYIPACMEALRGGYSDHKGVAAEGVVKSAQCLGDTKDKLKKFVKEIALEGLFCIDLIQSHGQLYFSEINLRGGGSGYGITLAGANLPGTLADIKYKNSQYGPDDIRQEVHFLNEMIEFEGYTDGYISLEDYKKHMSGGQSRFVKNKSDPAPWKEFKKLVIKRKIAKLLK